LVEVWQKKSDKNVDEKGPSIQFHQHFMSAFVPIYSCANKSSNLKCKYKKALRETFVQKSRA
jgi:hypothetical protein